MLVLSHRGYHRDVPENTLEAFELAIAMGVDGIETDVWLTADGVLALVHDRITPDGHDVQTLTHKELALSFGYEVPTLPEALDLSDDILWNIEIKSPRATPAAILLLRKFRHRKLLVTSFFHDVAIHVARECDVDCGLLIAHQPLPPLRSLFAKSSRSLRLRTIVWNFLYLTPELVTQARSAGLDTFVYGLETQPDHERVLSLEVTGAITDQPHLFPGISQPE